MLEDLKILNGTLSLDFSPYNTKYTIYLTNENDTEVKFSYHVSENAKVEVLHNTLKEGNNEIVLKVQNETNETEYFFNVYKEPVTNVFFDYQSLLEEEVPKEISPYAIPGIASICFLIILITFTLLFAKRRPKNHK